MRGADAGNGIRVFIPDIGMFVASLVTWLLCRSLERPPVKDASQQHNSDFMEAGKQVSVDAPVGLTMKVVVKPVILIQYTF